MDKLPDNIVSSLQNANNELQRSSKAIRDAYTKAEETGDYSDADELAADYRESLHDAFSHLLAVFAEQYPSIFDD